MFRAGARVVGSLGRASVSGRASVVRTFTAGARQSGKRFTAATVGGIATTGAVLAYTQIDQAYCDWKDWFSWIPGVKPADKYAAIRAEIAKVIADNEAGPILVRLAWHASGTYDIHDRTGGSNGATMRSPPECKHGANAGLQIARDLLEPIKKAHPELSYADLWTLAGAVAIEELGGPSIPWRAGRTDAADGSACPPDGRLPNASKNQDHVRDIFYRMGFNDREIVALLGAHTLGSCHADRSGYTGPWTRDPNGFDNSYYSLLLSDKWNVKIGSNPPQFEDPSGELMMLPADIALIIDPEFKKYVELYAKDSNIWFADFAKAFGKLLELGVKFQ